VLDEVNVDIQVLGLVQSVNISQPLFVQLRIDFTFMAVKQTMKLESRVRKKREHEN
jgi:metal-sulfur cluster biosynthetic enzyme